jgi:galactan 5-O-arabinofuranosyltransferase
MKVAPPIGTAPPWRTRLAGQLLRLVPWLLLPATLLLVYLSLPAASELDARYQASTVALVGAPLLGWLLTRRSAVWHHTAAALTACTLPALTAVALHGTDWFFSGPFGDQSFRLEYATRFAHDLGTLADYSYRDVPAFYSPGWFWLVGAASRVADVPAWQAYKWAAIATLYLAAAAAFALWRVTFGARTSALLLTVTVIGMPATDASWLGATTLLGAGASEPYSWLVTLCLPPLLTWFGARHGPFLWWRGVMLGAALAAAAWAYLLFAVVGALAVLVLLARRGAGSRIREVLVAAVTGAVLVLPWLGRFLVAWVDAGMPPSAATTWVEGESYGHLLSPGATPWFLVAALGAVALLALSGREHPVLRGCQALLGTVLVLTLYQLVAGQSGGGILAHRLVLVLGTALLAGATLAAVELLLPRLRDRRAPRSGWARPVAAALAVVLFLGLSAHAQEWLSMDSDLRKLALGVPYPDGRHSVLASRDMREQFPGRPSVDQLDAAVRQVAREAGQQEPGQVLCDDMSFFAASALHPYLQWWALYSNPLGGYDGRRAFLETLDGRSPDAVVAALRAAQGAPTVFVLRAGPDGYAFSSTAWSPDRATSTRWTVDLPPDLFDSPEFVRRQVGDRTVAALRPG